jgi:hypothetical protein
MEIRKKYITDVVEAYKRNHKEEMKKFKELMKQRRAKLKDKNLATFTDKKGRVSVSIPEGLWSALDMTIDDPQFLEAEGEIKWFAKKFPEFLIPYEY